MKIVNSIGKCGKLAFQLSSFIAKITPDEHKTQTQNAIEMVDTSYRGGQLYFYVNKGISVLQKKKFFPISTSEEINKISNR